METHYPCINVTALRNLGHQLWMVAACVRWTLLQEERSTHQISVDAAAVVIHVSQVHRHLVQYFEHLAPISSCDPVVRESIAKVTLRS